MDEENLVFLVSRKQRIVIAGDFYIICMNFNIFFSKTEHWEHTISKESPYMSSLSSPWKKRIAVWIQYGEELPVIETDSFFLLWKTLQNVIEKRS
jgi:hypothetical protein